MRPIYKVLEMVLAGPAFDYTCHAVEDLAKRDEITKKEEKSALKFIENEVEAYCKKIGKAGEYKTLINCFRSDPKYSAYESKMETTVDPFYVQLRKEWIESKIAKLKKNIRKPKIKPSILAVGDAVEIIDCPKAMAWDGWVNYMDNSIGTKGEIITISGTEAKVTCGNGFWYPISSLKKVKA